MISVAATLTYFLVFLVLLIDAAVYKIGDNKQ